MSQLPLYRRLLSSLGDRKTSLTVLTLAALIVRVLMAARSGLWRDEGLFVFIARHPSWSAMIDFLRFNESHPPLFYVLMRSWHAVSGWSEIAMLALPVLFGAALIPLVYFVGTVVISERVGLLAAALAAVSPSLSEYSGQVRPYSLLPLLALASIFFLIRGFQSGGLRVWTSYVLATLALMYTHNWAWVLLAGEWIAAFAIAMRFPDPTARGLVRKWIYAQAAILLAYVIWLPTLLHQAKFAGHGASLLQLRTHPVSTIAISAHRLVQATVLAYPPLDTPPGYPALKRLFLAIPILLLVVDQFLRARASQRAPATGSRSEDRNASNGDRRVAITCLVVVPIAAWIVALLLSEYSDMMLPGCLAMLAPALLLVFAWWLARPRKGLQLWIIKAAVVAIFASYTSGLYDIASRPRSNAREIARAVAARTQPSDLLLILPEWLASSFNYYYEPGIEQIDYPRFNREGAISYSRMMERFLDPAAFSAIQNSISNARQNGRRVWVIIDRSELYDVSPQMLPGMLADRSTAEFARLAQIRADLRLKYGDPRLVLTTRPPEPEYENLVALLFVPSSAAVP
ncbi:MAG TPA: glycosyltransferase family 39 protein [Gemmatimonadaceae bacterium]|nr:glycosyltransferase family 39 protein [Gemmatimonadaceae bacterium]